MDPLMQFMTWQFMLFSLAIAGGTFVLRLIVEFFLKNPTQVKVWEDLILPLFPLALGCVLGKFMTMYPYPEGLTSTGGHIVFGFVAGMFSGLVYRVLKALLSTKLQGIATDVNDLTGAAPAEQVDQSVIDSVRNSIQK